MERKRELRKSESLKRGKFVFFYTAQQIKESAVVSRNRYRSQTETPARVGWLSAQSHKHWVGELSYYWRHLSVTGATWTDLKSLRYTSLTPTVTLLTKYYSQHHVQFSQSHPLMEHPGAYNETKEWTIANKAVGFHRPALSQECNALYCLNHCAKVNATIRFGDRSVERSK